MGDIADMMLDGDLCEGCGVWMGSEGDGFPRRCASCLRDEAKPSKVQKTVRSPKAFRKVKCPTCGRAVKEVGMKQHMKDKHNEPITAGN